MMKKFLSLIAAFSLGSLASFEALAYTGDIWDVSAIESRDNPVTRNSADPVLPGEKVTFLIKLVNRDSNYNSDAPANDGNGYAWEFSSSTDGWKYPTITVDVGGHLAAAQIVDVGPSWYGETRLTWVICEYTVKPGDLADPFKIHVPTTTGAYQVLPFTSSTPAVSIVSKKGASEKISWTIYDGPEDFGDRTNNHNLATSDVKVRGATFGKGDSDKEGVWFSISENSTDSANKIEPSIKLLGWDNKTDATPLYIWSKDKKIISLEGDNLIPVQDDVYRLAFRDGECRFSLRAKGAENASTTIYVAPTIGLTAVGGKDQHCLIATVDITKAEPSSISVLFDGTYAKDGQAIKVPSSAKPNMTLSLGGKALNESVKIKLTAKYYNDNESKWVEDTEHKYIKFSSTANSENHNSEFTLDPKETKTVYYTLYGAPKHTDPEDDKSGILIIPEILEIGTGDEIAADKINSGRIIVTPDPSATLDLSGAFYNGHAREVSLKLRDTPRNLGFANGVCTDGLSKQNGYTIKWFNDENGDVSVVYDTTKTGKDDPKITFNAGEVVLSGINYDEAETYTSRIEITTPDGAVYKETFQVVVSALPTVKLVRVGHDLDDPIDENGDNFYFVLENPTEAMKKAIQNNTTSYYAYIGYGEKYPGSKLVKNSSKTPVATGTRSGAKIKFEDGVYKTAAFQIYFDDNCDIENPETYPVLTPVVINNARWSGSAVALSDIGGRNATLCVENAIPSAKVNGDTGVRVKATANFTAAITDGAKDLTDLPLIKELKVADNPYADDAIGEEPAFLTEWAFYIPAELDPFAIFYTYGVVNGNVSVALKEFVNEGDYKIETRMLDKDMITELLNFGIKLPEPAKKTDDGLVIIDAVEDSFFATQSWNEELEWDINSDAFPVGCLEFKVSNNPGMVIDLDENGQKNLGWYEGVGTPTFTVTLDEVIKSQEGKAFEIEFKNAVTGEKAKSSVIEILTSDIVYEGTEANAGKYFLKIPGRTKEASFSINAKDGYEGSRWTLTLEEVEPGQQSFMPGKVTFSIYNREPVVTVTSGIGAMVAAMKNQTNIVINADAGIDYEIRWKITNETTDNNYDGLEITWSNSNNRDTDTTFKYGEKEGVDADKYTWNEKVWKTSFVSPTKEDGAGHVITLAWQDKDGAANSFSWEVRVGASKTISLYPMGPTKGAVNEGLNNLYNTAAGKGKGSVSVPDYEGGASYSTSHNWKVGNVGEAIVKAVADKAIDENGDPIVGGYDSFFYTWLQVIRAEGAAGYTIERYGAPMPDVIGETSIPLPTQTNDDGTFSDMVFEAIFSKEFKPEDNCGDINQDGIPDIFVAKYKFGLYNAGKLEGSDLADISAFNEDEDYLPIPNELNAIGVIGTTNSWIDTARAFTAKSEIRGYFEGLNLDNATVVEDTEPITSEKTFYDAKKSDLEHWAYMQAVEAALGAEEWTTSTNSWVEGGQDLSVYKNADVCLDWTPENPTDPTKTDTDGDGLPDGYEYAIWYRAHVGWIEMKDGDRIPHKAEGSRYRLNPETNLPESQKITWQEIEERFNPTVALPEVDSYLSDFDNDGLSDWMEYQLGTDPCNWDTDGDGVPDGWEVSKGMNPLNAKDGNAEVSNPDGDVMAVAKAYVLNFELDGISYWWVVPNLMGGFGDPNSVNALEPSYEFVEKRDGDGNIVYEEDGVTPVKTLIINYSIEPGTEIIGAVLNTTTAPKVVDIPGTSRLLAVSAAALKSQKLYFPEDATIISYSTEPYSIIHDQVYNFYGFDPRVAWYTGNAKGLLGERWEGINGANKLGLSNYGVPTSTSSAFTTLNEYGYAFYCIHTKGAGVTDAVHPFQKDTNLINLATDPTKADSDNDGMPDGWELYVGLNPLSPANNPDYNLDPDNDGLTNAQEFFANDSCAAYAGVETIAGKADPKWLNKHWPTDPNDPDTDGDSILDGAEGGMFAYAAEPQDGKKIIYRGGGLNPNSVDTDLDGLPDAWEAQFAGTAIQVVGDTFNTVGNETALDQDTKKLIYPVESQIADGLRGDFTMTRASGSAMAEGTRYVVRGMDGTYEGDVATTYDPLSGLPDSADPATGTIRDFDFDHDGLENYQEYLTQAIRGFRYDDTETPLMGRSIIWKGDTNKGNYVEFEGGKPVSNMPDVDITGVFNLASLEIDESLIFPTFNYTDSAKFIQSMKKKVDVIDPDTLEKVGETEQNGPLLEHMMVSDNKFMNLVVPGEKRRILAGVFVDEEAGVNYYGVIIGGKTVKVEDMVGDPEYADYTVSWPDGDHSLPPTVERIGKNTDNITLPGVANVGYDYAKLGYFAYPKQSWDMAVMTTVHGNSLMSPRSKYMLPPTSMTHYYTTLSATLMNGEEDGTTKGYGSKREFASGYVSTSPRDADTDDDGMDDYYELFHGLNPLYGNLDVIGSKYGYTIKADKNLWTYIHEGTEDEIDRGKLFDPIKYPWAIGHQDCDADGDGLRNFDEAICANMASPTTYHTDPTPRWMTDPHGLLSYVRQFYGFDPTLSSMGWSLVDAQGDRYTGDLAKPKGWIASFEQTEGYDTDGDFVSDSSEVVKSTMPPSDPQNPADPARRQAMYFPGEKSAMMTRSDVVVNAWDSLEIFHTFTVECWLNPDSGNIGEEQVVFERAHWYDAAKKGDTGHYRANFRIGIDAEGQVYGLFDNDISETSGEDIVTTSQLITGPKLAIGDWTHVAMTFDGKALKLFINGELSKTVRASNDGSQTLIPANGVTAIIKNPTSDNYPLGSAVEMSGAFVLGATMTDLWHESKNIANLAKFYKGFVDEVRVWDGARTEIEISGDYNVRYGKDEISALRDNVYVSWCDGATRNDNDGKPVLPAELKCNWSFDQIPAALKSEDVAVTPAGFIKNVIDPVEWDADLGFNRRFFNVAWYVNEFKDALSTVYCNDYVNEGTYVAMTVPSAKNIAQQLPDYSGMLPDSHYWSQYISGMKPASDNSVESYTIPNTMNPYTDAIILGTRVLPYWRLIRFANITQNEELKELARKHRFHSRSMFSATTDLYPLGGAYAKLAPEMWDNQGPSDAWVDTLKNDAGLLAPEWWVTMKGGADGEYYTTTAPAKIIEDYLRDIAAGMQPDGEIKPEYASKSDVNTNGIPDWWEALYGLDGKTYDTDKDGLPDYIEYYVSEVLAKNLKLDEFRLDPTSKMSDGLTLDYFRKLGDLYLGEVFTDHDQMDDVWENKYDKAKISRYVYDPIDDLDMDGWTNYAEFRSNTDPTLYGARGLEDVQLSEYPIPAIAVHLETEDEISAGSAFIIAAKRSSLPAEEDNGSYDATWYIGAGNGENKKVNFTGSSEQPVEGDYSRLIGKYVEGVKTYHVTPGSISAGSVKIYAYDPNFYVHYTRTGANTRYVDTIAWAPFIHDISVSSSEGYLQYANTNIKVGTINYTTGTLTIDFRLLPEVLTLDYNLVTKQKFATNEQGTILGYYTSYVSLRNDVQFGIEWRALPIYGGRYNTYYLSEADEGHIREGKNDFIAFLDEDGDGKYTIGEPFGAVNGVDVGWDSAKLSIKLTKTNPLFPRFSIMSGENDRDYWYGVIAKPTTGTTTTTTEDGTEITYTPDASALNGRLVRVRVIRHSTNIGEFTKDKQVAVFDKYLNIDKRDYIHEGDILKAGQFDLDWDAAKDIFTGTTDYGEVRYNVVLGENGEYTNATQIVRYYDTKADDGRKTATNLKDVHCYNARPTFSWMMRPARDSNIEFNTYTAFKIQIKDKDNAVIYDSGCQPMPPADQEGYRNWTAPISFGDIVRGKLKYSILPYSGEFTWNIWIYNSKFQDDNNSYCASGKLSASIESEGKFVEGHGYGALDVTIKYAGPAMLLDKVLPSADDFDGSLPEGQIRVEAFETPDFSGDAVASAFVKKVDGELKTMVCGLEIGKAYYLRAYLDSDGDQQKSDWESWGCTTAPTTVTPVPNTVSFYIEDCDTDHDWLPDAWEYAKAGNLTKLGGNNEKKLIAAEGLWSLQLQGSMSLDKATQQKLLVAPSADTFVTESFASLLLGAPIDISDDGAIKGKIEDGSLVITGFKVENGKVKIDLDATVSSVLNTALAKLYKVEDNLKVKVVVLHTESLNGDWTEIGSKSDVTFGKEAQSIEIDLEETTPANGFYKVTIAQ